MDFLETLEGMSRSDLAAYSARLSAAFAEFLKSDGASDGTALAAWRDEFERVQAAMSADDTADADTDTEDTDTEDTDTEDTDTSADAAGDEEEEEESDEDEDEDEDEDDEDDEDGEEDASADATALALAAVTRALDLMSTRQEAASAAPAEESAADILKSINFTLTGLGQDVAAEADQAPEGARLELANGAEYTPENFHRAIADGLRNMSKGTDGEVLYLGRQVNPTAPVQLTNDSADGNFRTINESVSEFMGADDPQALTAALCCPPAEIIRNLSSYCSPSGLYTLPQVGVPRNGIRHAVPDIDGTFLFDIFEWDEGCDTPGNPPVNDAKDCTLIQCATYEDAFANAYGWCIEFDNGTARFNPEQLAYHLSEAACRFEFLTSDRLLTAVLNHPRTPAPEVCVADGAGVVGPLKEILAVKIRQLRVDLMNLALRPTVVVPGWLVDVVNVDNVRRGGGPSLDTIINLLGAQLQVVDWWQLPAGNVCEFPTDVEILIHAPGVYRELDGGEMNFGLVRDSTLNEQNRARIMFERWNGVAHFGPNRSVRRVAISDLCPNGAVGPRIDSCI